MRTIFIGDIHGMAEKLKRVLKVISPTSQDQLVFVGDLLDKGPFSALVVQLIRRL